MMNSLSYAGLIAFLIREGLKLERAPNGSTVTVDQPQQNSLYGIHQLRATVEIPGHTGTYRILIAPAEAPISIGGVPANDHFAQPIAPQTEG